MAAAATALASGCGNSSCRTWPTNRAGHRRASPSAGHQQMEQDRTPPVLVHQPELAREALGQLSRDRRSDRRDNDKNRPEGPLRTRHQQLSQRHRHLAKPKWRTSISNALISTANGIHDRSFSPTIRSDCFLTGPKAKPREITIPDGKFRPCWRDSIDKPFRDALLGHNSIRGSTGEAPMRKTSAPYETTLHYENQRTTSINIMIGRTRNNKERTNLVFVMMGSQVRILQAESNPPGDVQPAPKPHIFHYRNTDLS